MSDVDAALDIVLKTDGVRDDLAQRRAQRDIEGLRSELVREEPKHQKTGLAALAALTRQRRAERILATQDASVRAGPDAVQQRLENLRETGDASGQTSPGMRPADRVRRMRALQEDERMLDFYEKHPDAAVYAADDESMFSQAWATVRDFPGELAEAVEFGTEGFEQGRLQAELGRVLFDVQEAYTSGFGEERLPELWSRAEEIQKELQAFEQPEDTFDKYFASSAGQFAGQMSKWMSNAVVDTLAVEAAIGTGAALVASPTGPGAGAAAGAAVVATAPFVFTAALTKEIWVSEQGSMYGELVAEGYDAQDPATIAGARAYGMVSTFVEMSALKILGKAFSPVKDAAKTMVKPMLAQHAKSYLAHTTRRQIAREAGVAILKASAAEGAEEFIQTSLASAIGEAVAAGGDLNDVMTGTFERIPEALEAAAMAAGGLLLGGGLARVGTLGFEMRAAKRADQEQAFFEAYEELTTTSKMIERDPRLAGEFLDFTLNQDQTRNTVYVELGPFQKALESQGLTIQEWEAHLPGIRERVNKASETGGRVAIPAKEFASQIAGTPFFQKIREHVTADPTGLTPAQRVEQFEASQETADSVSEQAQNARVLIEDSADAATEPIIQQLVASGRFSPTAAKQQAESVRARLVGFSQVLSRGTGRLVTPEEAMQLAPLAVLSEAESAAISDGQILEQVEAAAVRFSDGQVFTGRNHGEAYLNAAEAGVEVDSMEDPTDGFLVDGEFQTRQETREALDLEARQTPAIAEVMGNRIRGGELEGDPSLGDPQANRDGVRGRTLRFEAMDRREEILNQAAGARPVVTIPNPFPVPKGSEARIGRKAKRAAKRREVGYRELAGNPKNAPRTIRLRDGSELSIGRITPDAWARRVESVGLTNEQIRDFRNWYREVYGTFMEIFGDASPAFAAAWLMAQQNASPQEALKNALLVREQVIAGLQSLQDRKKGGLADERLVPFWEEVIEEGLEGLGIEAGSQKLNDFVDAALGRATRTWMNNDPSAGEPAVADVHTIRDVGFVDQTFLDRIAKLTDEDVSDIAVDMRGAPTEAQYEESAQFLHDVRDYLNENDLLGGNFERVSEVQALGWMALLIQTGQPAQTVEDAVRGSRYQLSTELDPGVGSPFSIDFPGFSSLPLDDQIRLTDTAVGAALSQVMDVLGDPPIVNHATGISSWVKAVSASSQVTFLATEGVAQDVATALGYLLQQTEVLSGRELRLTPSGKYPSGTTHWFVDLAAPELDDQANQLALWDKVLEGTGMPLGYSPVQTDTGVALRIYLPHRDESGKLTRYGTGNVAKAMVRIEEEILQKIDLEDFEFDVQASYVPGKVLSAFNNWQENPNGEGYLERFANRPAVLERLRDSRSTVERIIREGVAGGVDAVLDQSAESGERADLGRERLVDDEGRPLPIDELYRGTRNTEYAQRSVYRALGMEVRPGENTGDMLKIYDLAEYFPGTFEQVDAQLREWLDRIGWTYKIFGPRAGEDGKAIFPDFQDPNTETYEQNTVWIFDPREDEGSFRDHAYTLAWRVTHEIAHALTNDAMTQRYGGRGRRAGAMGRVVRGPYHKNDTSLTLADAMRAVDWEYEAFLVQRDILQDEFGVEITDEQFMREASINLADATYRAITGQFGNPGEIGVVPTNVDAAQQRADAFALLQSIAREEGISPSVRLDAELGQETEETAGPRAQIALRDNAAFVRLTEQTELTDFNHELAHWFLHQMVVAHKLGLLDQQGEADLQTILDWTEAATVDDLLMPFEDGRFIPGTDKVDKPHEIFARGWEAHLATGKAPTAEMRGIFRSFRRWVHVVYGGIRATLQRVGKDLTPEIREVYDRLFDAELAVGEVSGNFDTPLFSSAEDAGMTESQWAKYQRAFQGALDLAVERVAKPRVAEITKRKREEARAERDRIRAEVEREHVRDPAWIVIRWLKRDEQPFDSPGAPEAGVGLSADRVRAIYGDEAPRVIELLNDSMYGRGRDLVASKNGIDPDAIAESFGFVSGREMIDRMLAARTVEQKINARVNREIAQAPYYQEDATLEEAHAQVANEDRELLLKAELRSLRKFLMADAQERARRGLEGEQTPTAAESRRGIADAEAEVREADRTGDEDLLRAGQGALVDAEARGKVSAQLRRADRAAGRRAGALELQLDAGIIQERAAELVGDLPVGRMAIERRSWNGISVREGKKARKALASRDYATALEAVERQLLAHYASAEVSRIEKEVRKGQEFAARILKPKSLERLRAPGFDGASIVQALFARYDMRKTKASDPTKAPTKMGRALTAAVTRAQRKEAFESLLQFKEKADENALRFDFAPFLANDNDARHWTELSVSEFLGLIDTVRNIDAVTRQKARDIRTGKAIEIQDAANEVAERISFLAESENKPTDTMLKARGLHRDAIRAQLRHSDASLLKPEDMIDFMGGDFIDNPVRAFLWENVNQGVERYRDLVAKWVDPFDEIMANVEWSRMHEKVKIPGMNRQVYRYQVFMMALNAGTNSNWYKLVEGYKRHRDFGWDEDLFERAFAELNDAEWDAVQQVWDLFSTKKIDVDGKPTTLQELLFEHEFQQTGRRPSAVESRSFTTPTGKEMRGGYFPLVYDPTLHKTAKKIAEDIEAKGMFGYSHVKTETQQGHLQSRVEGFVAPILLDPTIIGNHLERTLHDVALREPIASTYRILNSTNVQAAIEDSWGLEYHTALNEWLKKVARVKTKTIEGPLSVVANLSRWARQGTTTVGLGFRIGTGVLQLTGLFPIFGEVGWGHTTFAINRFKSNPIAFINRAMEMSPELRSRAQTRDRDMQEQLQLLRGANPQLQRVRQHQFIFITLGDRVVSSIAWDAQYGKSIQEHGDEARAVREADRAIRRTQGGGDVKDNSLIRNTDNELLRWLTLFGTFASNLYARQRRIYRTAAGKQAEVDTDGKPLAKRNLPHAMSLWAATVFMPAVLEALMREWGDDDKIPDDTAAWAKYAAGHTAAFSVMPVPLVSEGITSLMFPERRVFSGRGPSERFFRPIYGIAGTAEDFVVGEDVDGERLLRDTLAAVGLGLHIPTGQLDVWVDNFWDQQQLQAPDSPRDFIWRKPKE